MRRHLIAFAALFLATSVHAREVAEQKAGAKDCAVFLRTERKVTQLTWSGACKDGHAEGTGVLEWKHRGDTTMSRYEGGMQKGRWHGDGYVKTAYGVQYEGGFREGLAHGIGAELSDSGRYDGSFVAGEYDGTGKKVYNLGGSYEGQWKGGKFHGKGTVTYAGGRTMTAEFVEGRRVDQAPLPAASERRFRIPQPNSFGESMATSTGLPFSSSYDELSPAEKQVIRSVYVLDDDDEPPYPANGTKKLHRRIGEAQAVRRAQGRWFGHVLVDSQGNATSVEVFASPDPFMTQWIASVVGQEKFKPGVCQGKPCPMRFPISIVFSID